MRAKSDRGFACALHRIEQLAHLCKLIMDSTISYLQNIDPDSWLRHFVFYQPSISNDGNGNAKDTAGGNFFIFLKDYFDWLQARATGGVCISVYLIL